MIQWQCVGDANVQVAILLPQYDIIARLALEAVEEISQYAVLEERVEGWDQQGRKLLQVVRDDDEKPSST